MATEEEAYRLAGDRLGKFTILEELGRGSMGVVYEAFQEDLKRKVAIKVLPANIALDAKQVRRFRREAESVARLRHDNVIQIFEVGQLENTHYFSMELVDGDYFGQDQRRDKESIRTAVALVRDAARGLAHAHERGVIHRDIKPTNLLVDRSGRVVVTDFGLARIKDSASLTSTDAIVGTPKYMSPEQILPGSRPLDGRTDVYSLGATLYEVVAGRPPIDAPSVQVFLRAILEERPVSPRRVNKEVPHDLATIILRCLEKDPEERYAGAKEFADDLDRFLAGERIVARPKGMLALGYETARRHRVITALAVVAAIALGISLWLGSRVATETYESRLLTMINDLRRPQSDLDLAIQKAEDLAFEYPAERIVAEVLKDLYSRHAMAELEAAEVNFEGVLADLERAGLQGSFWHLMVLGELRRFAEAKETAQKLEGEPPEQVLALARCDLALGTREACERAIQRLEALKGDLHCFYHLTLGRAYRRLAQLLGATGGDPMEVRRYRLAAQQRLTQARALAQATHQRWLRARIDIESFEVKVRLGESVNIADAVGDLSAVAANAVERLATVWEGMTQQDVDNVQAFVQSILRLSDLKLGPPAELERRARERLKGSDARERAIGNLILAVAHLSDDLPELAQDALFAADNYGVPALGPYVLWGQSLALRADDNLPDALTYALQAMDVALGLGADFEDLELLARHTALLTEEAHSRKQVDEARRAARFLERTLRGMDSPAAWVSEILQRLAAPAGTSTPPR